MRTTNSNHDLLLDLDAFMDTRYGTLLRMGRKIANTCADNGYRYREFDDFGQLSGGLITHKQFQEEYAKRNMITLKRSIMTGLVVVLREYIKNLEERLYRGVDVTRISVTINTFPYVLPGLLCERYVQTLAGVLPPYVVVGHGRYDPKKLTPQVMKESFDAWCTYEFDSWLTTHHQALLMNKINQLAVILPRLHVRDPGEFKDEEDTAMEQLDMTSMMEMVMEEFIHLEHLPVMDFCYYVPQSYSSGSASSTASKRA